MVLASDPGMIQQDIAPAVNWPDREVSVLGLFSLHIKGMLPVESFATSKNWLAVRAWAVSPQPGKFKTAKHHNIQKVNNICNAASVTFLLQIDYCIVTNISQDNHC